MLGSLMLTMLIGLRLADANPVATCPPPRVYWMAKGPIYGLHPPITRIGLSDHGRLSWNKRPITVKQLHRFIRLLAQFDPKPILLFDPAAGAPCDVIEIVRSAMDRDFGCRTGRVCGEGNLEEWQRMPIPKSSVVP